MRGVIIVFYKSFHSLNLLPGLSTGKHPLSLIMVKIMLGGNMIDVFKLMNIVSEILSSHRQE